MARPDQAGWMGLLVCAGPRGKAGPTGFWPGRFETLSERLPGKSAGAS